MTNKISNILLADSYKYSMHEQYPKGTEHVYSYVESRGGKYNKTLFFGLQAFIKEYMSVPITKEDVEEAKELIEAHGLPFNYHGWMYIVNKHNGYMPVIIKAVPEGSVVPVKNVLATIENTDPKCFWLTTHLETALLRAIWYPTTVATQSYHIKQLIRGFLQETGDVAGLPYKLHDFGSRGVSSEESAMLGGMAHLVNFMGTDNISALVGARKYYDSGMAGHSIPAAEHSTITSWGRDSEADAYRNMLVKFAKPGSLVAVVSDSYDIYNACEHIWGEELKQEVIDSGATVIIRPDSGDPETVVMKCLKLLDKTFGHTVNSKGYKVLNNVRLIQGDGVNYNSIQAILSNMKINSWSADNIAFGMGGALLQGLDRDTQKFAMKCSAIRIKDVWHHVQKDPITDSGKKSKSGRVTLYLDRNYKNEGYTSAVEDWDTHSKGALETVYFKLLGDEPIIGCNMTLDEIRFNSEVVQQSKYTVDTVH